MSDENKVDLDDYFGGTGEDFFIDDYSPFVREMQQKAREEGGALSEQAKKDAIIARLQEQAEKLGALAGGDKEPEVE